MSIHCCFVALHVSVRLPVVGELKGLIIRPAADGFQIFYWARFKRRTTTSICWIELQNKSLFRGNSCSGHLKLICSSPRTERSVQKKGHHQQSRVISHDSPAQNGRQRQPGPEMTTAGSLETQLSMAIEFLVHISRAEGRPSRAMDWG